MEVVLVSLYVGLVSMAPELIHYWVVVFQSQNNGYVGEYTLALLDLKTTMFVPALDPHPMVLEELVLCPAPLCSTGAACAQGRLLPRASCGPVRCVGVCLGLRVRVYQRRLRRFFCCFHLLSGPLPVDPRLLPPPPGYPCARPSY